MSETTASDGTGSQPGAADPASGPGENFQVLIVVFVCLDMFCVPLSGTAIEAGMMGVVILEATVVFLVAQFCLIAIWGVLGTQRLFWRTSGSMLVGMGLYGFAGLGIAGGRGDAAALREFFSGELVVPLMMLILQGPIWSLRLLFNWTRTCDEAIVPVGARASRQFNLGDMMVMTAAVAVALGLAKAYVGLAAPGVRGAIVTSAMWMGLLGTATFMVGLSLLLVFPCLAGCLMAKRLKTGQGALAIYGVVLIVGGLLFVIWQGPPPDAMPYVVLFFVIVVGVPLLTVGGTLSVVRRSGFRLILRSRSLRTAVADEQTGCPFARQSELGQSAVGNGDARREVAGSGKAPPGGEAPDAPFAS